MPPDDSKDKITVVFWDIDGTLAETEVMHDHKYRAVTESFIGRPVTDAEWFYTVGIPEPKMFELLQKRFPEVNDFPRFHEEAKEFYLAHVGEIAVRPGIPQALALLEAAGTPMAAVSGSRTYAAQATLGAIGIHPPGNGFSFVLGLDDLDGRPGKPAPDCYLIAKKKMAALLGVAEDRINGIAVEDSPTGAEAAKAAGMTLIFRPTDPAITFPAADITVHEDAELLAAFKKLACPAPQPAVPQAQKSPRFPSL